MESGLITDESQLEEIINQLAAVPIVGIDTEFVREKTYIPALALIQISDGKNSYLIDPLSDITPQPMLRLLTSNALKVFHSPFQDFETLLRYCGELPAPYFDTQIAANFLGYPHSPSYGLLIQDFIGVELDKSSQHTNWLKRPLDQRQIEYARREVIFLPELYDKIRLKLLDAGRLPWALEEMQRYLDKNLYTPKPEDAYRRIKTGRLTPLETLILREAASAREEYAVNRNLPRAWVMKDAELVEIARHKPRTVEDLKRILPTNRPSAVRTLGKNMIDAVERAHNLPYPPEVKPARPSQREMDEQERIKIIIRQAAQELNLPEPLLATTQDIKNYIKSPPTSILSQGWRLDALKDRL